MAALLRVSRSHSASESSLWLPEKATGGEIFLVKPYLLSSELLESTDDDPWLIFFGKERLVSWAALEDEAPPRRLAATLLKPRLVKAPPALDTLLTSSLRGKDLRSTTGEGSVEVLDSGAW